MTKVKSPIKVRKIDFQFDADIPFHWNSHNPYWSNFVNYITLIAPAFERYFINATRQAMDSITEEAVREEAELFCFQEAQHSKHHLSHLKVLTHHHPELNETWQAISDSYKKLFAEQTLDFHLSYAATVELFFGPFAKFVINNIDVYFKGGDGRIRSFILWHLVEEFEHRNAAIDIYNDVVGSYWYRIKTLPRVIAHLTEVALITVKGLKQHAAVWPNGINPADTKGLFKGVPLLQVCGLFYELFCTLLPLHRPDNIKQPEWVTLWFEADASGVDMRNYYP